MRFLSRVGWVIVALAIAGCGKKADNGMQKAVEGACNADSDCVIDCSKKDECCPVASCETAVLRSAATEIANYNAKACTDDKKKSCAPAGPSVASARCESGKCVAKRVGGATAGSTPAGASTGSSTTGSSTTGSSTTGSTTAGSTTAGSSMPAQPSGHGSTVNGGTGTSQPEGGGGSGTPTKPSDPFVVDMTPFSLACKSKADCRIVKNDPCNKCSCGAAPIASSEAMKFETALGAIDCKKAPKDDRRCGECRGNLPDCVAGKCVAVPEK